MTKPLPLKVGDRVTFIRNIIMGVRFPKLGMKGHVKKVDSVEGYFIVWDDRSRFCWCYRKELRRLPDRKEGE